MPFNFATVYESIIVLGAGNTGLSMAHQAGLNFHDLAPYSADPGFLGKNPAGKNIFLCGTEGHPGKTKDVVGNRSAVTAATLSPVPANLRDTFGTELEFKSDVKIGDLQSVVLARQTSKKLLVVVCTTIDVHDDIAKELGKCNLSGCDIIAHPGFFLGHYLRRYAAEASDAHMPQPGHDNVFHTDVTIYASRAEAGGKVILSGKKNGLEVSRFGGEVTDAQRQLLADFFMVSKDGIQPTNLVTMLANVANPYAHLIKTLGQLPRIAAGESLKFYLDNTEEEHNECEAFAADMQAGWAQIGVSMIKFMDKVNGMYPDNTFESFHAFCKNSPAHIVIPTSPKTDTRTLWEEWVFLGLFKEIFARFGVTVGRLNKYYDGATEAIKTYCEHQLAKQITLTDLGIDHLSNDQLVAGINGVF